MQKNKAYSKISLVLVTLLIFSMIPYMGSGVYAATTIPNGGIISADGEYQLPDGYSGIITIADNVNTVTIIGDTDNDSNIGTSIVVAGGRSGALELTIENLDIIALGDGIDFGACANDGYEHKLYISGNCKIDCGIPFGTAIHVPTGVQVIIDKMNGLLDSQAQLEAIGGEDGRAGIGGGNFEAGGTITINGGTVTAVGGRYGAGIGGGNEGAKGIITINGGSVTATGGEGAAGIGTGGPSSAPKIPDENETITIKGSSTVIATGGEGAAGIGGGYYQTGGKIKIINNPTVIATGIYGEDIGDGSVASSGLPTLLVNTSNENLNYIRTEIIDSNTGQGIPNATVEIEGVTYTTNDNGITGYFVKGTHNYQVSAKGYVTLSGVEFIVAQSIRKTYTLLDIPPILNSLTVNKNILKLNYGEALDTSSVPEAKDFEVRTSGGININATSITISDDTVTLSLEKDVKDTDTVTISYTKGTQPIQDSAGSDAASFTNKPVVNNTLEAIAPILNTADVNKNILKLTYDEALDTLSIPDVKDFEVRTSGGINIAVASVTISDATVTLTLNNAVKHTDTVTISYAKGTNLIKDLAGNEAVSFTDKPVINNTPNSSTDKDGNSGGGGNSGGSTPPKNKVTLGDGVDIPVNTDEESKKATINIDLDDLNKSFEEGKGETVQIKLPSIDGISSYKTELPKNYFDPEKGRKIEVATDIGTITIPSNMLDNQNIKKDSTIGIHIEEADTKTLSDKIKDQIGDRPVIELSLTIDGEQQNWENKESSITISIPYTPSEKERLNPEHIVIWYIDGNGNAIEVPNGRYNEETGMVDFETTHFSYYAINYVEKTFEDITSYPWAKHQIEVLASKGIINGINETKYAPQVNITRADFLTLLVRTLELNADFENNFEDVKEADYYYESVGIAKALGITKGDTNNNFNPKAYITRQDMMVFTYRALVLKNIFNDEIDLSILEQYNDIENAAKYSHYAISILADNELIKGYNGQINPLGNTTRAEIAVLLYRIYNLI